MINLDRGSRLSGRVALGNAGRSAAAGLQGPSVGAWAGSKMTAEPVFCVLVTTMPGCLPPHRHTSRVGGHPGRLAPR
jgi:hypothetical protein